MLKQKFDYDEILKLPQLQKGTGGDDRPPVDIDEIEVFDPDKVKELREQAVGLEGMKVDRKLFEKAKQTEIYKNVLEKFSDANLVDVISKNEKKD